MHQRSAAKRESQQLLDTGSSSLFAKSQGGIGFEELRGRITIVQVLGLLNWEPRERRGDQLRGGCPIHRSENERSRSFSVNLRRNVFQCFAASCAAKGNQLDLFAQAMGLPIYQAALELCVRLGIEPVWNTRRR